MRFVVGLLCGLALGVVGVWLWVVWYFRDVMR